MRKLTLLLVVLAIAGYIMGGNAASDTAKNTLNNAAQARAAVLASI